MGAFDDEDLEDDDLALLFADEDDDAPVPDAREEERVAGFPAFTRGRRHGRKFADTWWGNAWIEAMEDTALDAEQLGKGRKYAFAGQVGPITVQPGRITAATHDGDHLRPFATHLVLRRLSDAEWERFLDKVATRAGHIAALLERELPTDLVRTAADAGVTLLPGFSDLDPHCDCPDWDIPCKHAAALAYQVSWLLDKDPFVLLLARGRTEEELTAELLRRNARLDGHAEAPAERGVDALAAWEAPIVPLPATLLPAPRRTRGGEAAATDLAALLADTEVVAPVDTAALAVLALDAADRAAALLATGPEAHEVPAGPDRPGEPDPAWTDAVRLAARAGSERLVAQAAGASGRPRDFPRAARAWQLGGAEGLAVLQDAALAIPTEVLARGRRTVADVLRERAVVAGAEDTDAAGDPAAHGVSARHNRWTFDERGVQVRLGRDERWYPFSRQGRAWVPCGAPGRDLAGILESGGV